MESVNVSALLTKLTDSVVFSDAYSTSLEQIWTLSSHARQIPICQFWHRRVLGTTHTTRKPILLLRSSRVLLLRVAERQFSGLLPHEPPLHCLPLFYSYQLSVNSQQFVNKINGLLILVMIPPPYPQSWGKNTIKVPQSWGI